MVATWAAAQVLFRVSFRAGRVRASEWLGRLESPKSHKFVPFKGVCRNGLGLVINPFDAETLGSHLDFQAFKRDWLTDWIVGIHKLLEDYRKEFRDVYIRGRYDEYARRGSKRVLPVVPEALIACQQIAAQLPGFLIVKTVVLLPQKLWILGDPKNIHFGAAEVVHDLPLDVVIGIDPPLVLDV
jgi:hypothetical protein